MNGTPLTRLLPRFCCLLLTAITLPAAAQYITPSPLPAVARDKSTTASTFTVELRKNTETYTVNAALPEDTLSLTASVTPDSADLNASADIFVVIKANDIFYQRTPAGGFRKWAGTFGTLLPTMTAVTLNSELSIPVFSGVLGKSLDFKVFLAYRRSDSENHIYTAKPASFSVNSGSTAATAFHTPAPIIDELRNQRLVSWPQLGPAPADRQRFAFGPAASADITVLEDDGSAVLLPLATASELAAQTSLTDELLLRTMFKFIAEEDGGYRIVATKHSNYAIDSSDGSNRGALILRDYRSGMRNTASAAYLVFELAGNKLTASARKTYDAGSGTFQSDGSWQSAQLQFSAGSLLLGSSGSELKLYDQPINFDIPFDFNPEQRSRVSNPEVTPQTKVAADEPDPVTDMVSQILPAYSSQVAAAGINDNTTASAAAMLAQISADLAAEGAALRYPAEFYLAFRRGLLSRVLLSSDSTDGIVGQLTVPYVFFTNETDLEGTHHPFMVIVSYGLPDSLALLWDVARPPGDGLTGTYEDQAVTRSYHRENFLTKIPLRDYGLVQSLGENTMVNDLASDAGETQLTHHNYASINATGIAIDGVVIYPSYNNTLHVSQEAAELSAHGMHAGRGLAVHYHADAHSTAGTGLNLYNDGDYQGHTHPPVVSIGFDGVAGYGLYRAGDTSSAGVNVPLDEFGGHQHDVYGYHYHSHTSAETTTPGKGPQDPAGGVAYTAHKLPPLGAWAGRINDIPEFWKGPAPDYVGGKSHYLGNSE